MAAEPRVLFVTTGLRVGGAEKQLARLLSRLHGTAIDSGVVSLLGPGPVSAEIEELGVPVWHLGVERISSLARALPRLIWISRRFRPALIQGWMYHGNLAARWATYSCSNCSLLFGIRQSLYDIAREKPMTRRVIRWNARISRAASAVIYNSETARRQHEAFDFSAERGCVIDNGFDTNLFRPDEGARAAVRAELGIEGRSLLIGLIARRDPMKGHEVFLDAAAQVSKEREDVHFLLAGNGVHSNRPPFDELGRDPPLSGRLHLLGERSDIARLTAALDIASSSSLSEAFPNTIGEAMACGVPCVATDVGDSRRIIAETGVLVSAGSSERLAAGLHRLLNLSTDARRSLGQAARDRIIHMFGIEAMVARFGSLYSAVVGEDGYPCRSA